MTPPRAQATPYPRPALPRVPDRVPDLRDSQDPLEQFESEAPPIQPVVVMNPAPTPAPLPPAAAPPARAAQLVGSRSRFTLSHAVFALAVVLALAAVSFGVIAYRNRQTPSVAEPITPPPPPAPTEGEAVIESRPAGAIVFVDGVQRGLTPLRVTLPTGTHDLDLQIAGVKRSLHLAIDPRTIASQYVEFAPLSQPAPAATQASVARSTPTTAAGWIAISMPFEVQLIEDGRVIGTSAAERIMVASGLHHFELANRALEFRSPVDLTVAPGKVATTTPVVPDGKLSINAIPWAEVWIDGRPYGATPLANVSIPIGNHDVVWRHPRLGELRRSVAVTAVTPVKLGIDFGK